MRSIILSAALLLVSCAGETVESGETPLFVDEVRILSIVKDGEQTLGQYRIRVRLAGENQDPIANAAIAQSRRDYQILSYSMGTHSLAGGTTCRTLICVERLESEYWITGRELLNFHFLASDVAMPTLSDSSEIFVIMNSAIEPTMILVPKDQGLSSAMAAEIFDRLSTDQ